MSDPDDAHAPWEPTPTTGKVRPDDIYYLITDPPTNGIGVWRSRAGPTPSTPVAKAEPGESGL
jgi:hypothetical protein